MKTIKDKKLVLKAFNTYFFEFLEYIIDSCKEGNTSEEEVQALRKGKFVLENLNHNNPTIIIKAWYVHVYFPYKDEIENGNIYFFIDKDYNRDISNMKHGSEIMSTIDKIREPIRNLSTEHKQKCSVYIQNINKLSLLYNT